MSRFIRANNDDLINLDTVTRLCEIRDDKGKWRVYAEVKGANVPIAAIWTLDKIEEWLAPTVPAIPGFIELVALESDSGVFVAKAPIIAWRISRGGAEPISIEDNERCVNEIGRAVLCPDGRVFDPGNAEYDDETKWLKSRHELSQWADAQKKAK
jgi:hypothetical protein